MVEGVQIAHPLPRQMLQRHPGPKNDLPASCGFQAAGHTIGIQWLMDHPALLGVARVKGFPSPERFQESSALLSGAG